VDETLQNHPDWPSLLSISDALSKWNIPNASGKIEKQDIIGKAGINNQSPPV
jgi:hypothetical protein